MIDERVLDFCVNQSTESQESVSSNLLKKVIIKKLFYKITTQLTYSRENCFQFQTKFQIKLMNLCLNSMKLFLSNDWIKSCYNLYFEIT